MNVPQGIMVILFNADLVGDKQAKKKKKHYINRLSLLFNQPGTSP